MSTLQAVVPRAEGTLPGWAAELMALYEADSVSQFLIYGNVEDRFLLPAATSRIGSLQELLFEVLLLRFDVVLSYDLGNGIRIERGGALFAKWPTAAKNEGELPRNPRAAIEFLTHFFRYCANLTRVGQTAIQVACFVRDIDLIAPAGPLDHELAALITLIRNWSSEPLLVAHPLATFLIARNMNDAHLMLARNPRSAALEIPVPSAGDLYSALTVVMPQYPDVLTGDSIPQVAAALAGSTLSSVERALKLRQHGKDPFSSRDLIALKKRNIETECRDLIEFVESRSTLDAIHGCEPVKQWLRQDIALWSKGEVAALPKGYLLCGPVGTGKSYMVECLAGEAGVPVVKLRNFRDRWVGSTEGNLEHIFRLLRALDRCYVFIDEADQTLGRRDTGNDSGVSGRIYSMLVEEMGSSRTRGRVIWILASSRPDLIEVDFKRPGRVDVKIPLLPAANPEQTYDLMRAACQLRGLTLPITCPETLLDKLPRLLTPGAAENIAVKTFRFVKTASIEAAEALGRVLEGYQPAVPEAVLEEQIRIAIAESSDVSFVPPEFR